jgi:hypothetical protein
MAADDRAVGVEHLLQAREQSPVVEGDAGEVGKRARVSASHAGRLEPLATMARSPQRPRTTLGLCGKSSSPSTATHRPRTRQQIDAGGRSSQRRPRLDSSAGGPPDWRQREEGLERTERRRAYEQDEAELRVGANVSCFSALLARVFFLTAR